MIRLQRISTGTYQLKSTFGAKGDKSFRIAANIDGCISAKIVPVKVILRMAQDSAISTLFPDFSSLVSMLI